eukprot:357278-Chlamydomonas_euryale.AAC.1
MAQHDVTSSTSRAARFSLGGIAAVSSGARRYDVLNSMYSDTCSSLIMRVPVRASGWTQLHRTTTRDVDPSNSHTESFLAVPLGRTPSTLPRKRWLARSNSAMRATKRHGAREDRSPVAPTPSARRGTSENCHTREDSGSSAPSAVKDRSTKPCVLWRTQKKWSLELMKKGEGWKGSSAPSAVPRQVHKPCGRAERARARDTNQG